MSSRSPGQLSKTQHDMLNVTALELKALGYSEMEAAEKIGVGRHKVRMVHQEINKEWRDRLLSSLMRDNIALEYGATIELNRIIIRKAFEVYDSTKDSTGRVKIEALRVIADTNHRTGLLLGDSQLLARSISKVLVVHPAQAQPAVEEESSQEDGGQSSNEQTNFRIRSKDKQI